MLNSTVYMLFIVIYTRSSSALVIEDGGRTGAPIRPCMIWQMMSSVIKHPSYISSVIFALRAVVIVDLQS